MRRPSPLGYVTWNSCVPVETNEENAVNTRPEPSGIQRTRRTLDHAGFVIGCSTPPFAGTSTRVALSISGSALAPTTIFFPSGDQAGPSREKYSGSFLFAIVCGVPLPSAFEITSQLSPVDGNSRTYVICLPSGENEMLLQIPSRIFCGVPPKTGTRNSAPSGFALSRFGK